MEIISSPSPDFFPTTSPHGHLNSTPQDKSMYPRVDDVDPEESTGDEWLPITASRNAKWYYSAFHNVTAMVGAGVLALPFAMSELGWGPGVTVLLLSWIITLYTLWQMVEMHEMVPGRRFDRYHELGQAAFGKRLGLYIVVPQQLLVEVSVCIVYMLTGGQSLLNFRDLVVKKTTKEDCNSYRLRICILIFATSQFALSFLRNFNSISGVSLLAAVMSVSYSMIAWGASLDKPHDNKREQVEYGYKANNRAKTVFSFFSALGQMAFAYAGHNVVLEIQATIPSTPEKPSKRPMWRGAIVAYIIVAFCYFPVALIGYKIFGNGVEDNILKSLKDPEWLMALANIFVAVHLVGSYQVYAMPVFDMIESVFIKKWHFRPSKQLRLSVRFAFVGFTLGFAIALPYFNALLSFFGGFVFSPTSYFLPCIIWLKLKRPKNFSLSWWINWICIVLGILLLILAPMGGLKILIDQVNQDKLKKKCPL